MTDHLTAGQYVRDYRQKPSQWLKGELLEQAIVRTLRRLNRPMDWPEIVTHGALGTRSTGFDRNSAIAALVGRGDVLTEPAPNPNCMWEKIAVFYLPEARTAEGGADHGNR